MAQPTQHLSKRMQRPENPTGLLLALFALVTVVGLVLFFVSIIRPLMQASAASDWIETPCTVDWIGVATHHSLRHGGSYSIDVRYSYEYGGRTLSGLRYDFVSRSSDARRWHEEVVNDLTRNRQTVCFVNPANPTESVLRRELPPDVSLWLFPLFVIAFGTVGVFFSARGWRRRTRQHATGDAACSGQMAASSEPISATLRSRDDLNGWLPAHDDRSGPRRLAPAETRLRRAWSSWVLPLIWNGAIGVLVWRVKGGFLRIEPSWPLALIMLPFVLLGLGLLASAFINTMRLVSPKINLTVTSNAVALGNKLDVAWQIVGRAGRVRRLHISIDGQEQASYSTRESPPVDSTAAELEALDPGRHRRTDKRTFASLTLIDTDDPAQIAAGAASITIPADAMHSFTATYNKIVWQLHVHGRIRRWPDVEETFPIVVVPAQTNG